MPPLPATLTRETGYTGSPYYTSGYPWDPSEPNPELQWPYSVWVYDRMRREDAQVAAVRRAIRMPLLNANWAIDPAAASEKVTRFVADNLGLPILGAETDTPPRTRTRGRFSFIKHLKLAMLALDYGHMPFEQVYRIEGGQAWLDRLAPRMPVTLAQIMVDKYGVLDWIKQYPSGRPGAGIPDPITADRLVWYANDQEGAAYQGVSIWRTAYKHWLLKDRLLRADTMKHERNGMGVPIYESPPNAQKADIDAGQQLAEKYRVGEAAGGAIPHGAKLSLIGVTGTLPDTLASIEYHDEAIARNALTQFLQLGSTKTGSRALGDSFIDFFKLAEDGYATELADVSTAEIVEDLVDLNWGEGEPAPRIVVGSVDVEADLPPDALVALASSGAITLDDGLESHLRTRYHLPPRSGAARPVTDTSPPKLPSATELATVRGRPIRAAATPTLRKGKLVGAFKSLYDRRVALEAQHRQPLAAAMAAVAKAVDVSQLVTQATAGRIAATSNPIDPADVALAGQVARAALTDATAGKAGDYLRLVGQDAITDGMAEGATSAVALLDVADGGVGIDWDIEFRTMLDALSKTGDVGGAVDEWISSHLGAQAAAVGRAVAQVIADGGSRTDAEDAVSAALTDETLTGPILDHAIAQAMGVGTRDYYAESGVASVDFLTAGDAQVDQECDDAENNGPYPPTTCPLPPLHFECRCALAPSGEAIRALASGTLPDE